MPLTLPTLTSTPQEVEEHLKSALQEPHDPAIGPWLAELIKNSTHLTTPEHHGWRLLSMIWLAAAFDIETAWPYLLWLNMNEPVIAPHLSEILDEAVERLDGYLPLATWIAEAEDERFVTFFEGYQNFPPIYKLPDLLRRLLLASDESALGLWLAAFCRATADDTSEQMRPWRLFTAAWYATCFDHQAGLTALQDLSEGQSVLSAADNQRLTEAAASLGATSLLLQWLAACPDSAVKEMLKEIGHPDLTRIVEERLQTQPDYETLTPLMSQAIEQAHRFRKNLTLLEQIGIAPETAYLLDVACGPLASQSVLFNSMGYRTTAVDLNIPPGYLPISGVRQWFKRRKHQQSWKKVTVPYYQDLAQASEIKLNWQNLEIKLGDLTRLPFPNHSFTVVVCNDYLPYAPDVSALLAEIERVLQSGGVFLADIRPYAALSGGSSAAQWEHLREKTEESFVFNRWRETQYRTAFEKHFTIEQWITEQDPDALEQLTSEIQAELTEYSSDELTRKEIIVLARKRL